MKNTARERVWRLLWLALGLWNVSIVIREALAGQVAQVAVLSAAVSFAFALPVRPTTQKSG